MVRGRDWKWGDQDGGSGHVGTLSEVTAWSEWPRSGAKVIWNLLRSNTYRTGYQGLVCSSVKIHVHVFQWIIMGFGVIGLLEV